MTTCVVIESTSQYVLSDSSS